MLELRLRDGYVMTKGDRDKLRAELAGKAMAAMIGDELYDCNLTAASDIATLAVEYAEALMAELGLKVEE